MYELLDLWDWLHILICWENNICIIDFVALICLKHNLSYNTYLQSGSDLDHVKMNSLNLNLDPSKPTTLWLQVSTTVGIQKTKSWDFFFFRTFHAVGRTHSAVDCSKEYEGLVIYWYIFFAPRKDFPKVEIKILIKDKMNCVS